MSTQENLVNSSWWSYLWAWAWVFVEMLSHLKTELKLAVSWQGCSAGPPNSGQAASCSPANLHHLFFHCNRIAVHTILPNTPPCIMSQWSFLSVRTVNKCKEEEELHCLQITEHESLSQSLPVSGCKVKLSLEGSSFFWWDDLMVHMDERINFQN